MRYLLLLSIVLVSLCAGLPEIPFINQPNTTVSNPGTLIIDSESPDLFVSVDTVPNEVKTGRDVSLLFQMTNKNPYSLDNINFTIYDPCIFSGDTEKNIAEIKANSTKTFSLKLTAGDTNFEQTCSLKFRITYDTEYSSYNDIIVLTKDEYEQREMAGTLNNIPIQQSFPSSPFKISLRFSEEQPFMNEENYFMYLDYNNIGGGVLDVKSVTLSFPSNVKDFSCSDYQQVTGGPYPNSFSLKKIPLSFINNRASTSSCSFNTSASQPIDIKSLAITASYKYVLDNSISIRVRLK